MNWTEPISKIKHKKSDFKSFGFLDKLQKRDRVKLLGDRNYTCEYCGGLYPKYLNCTVNTDSTTNEFNKYSVSCRLCYILTHLNYSVYKELKIFHSQLSQIDIIHKTIDHIIEHNDIPTPHIIDPTIKIVDISILEYINILNRQDLPYEINNLKIFINSKFNIDFVISNYCKDNYKFVDIHNDTDEIKTKYESNILKHKFKQSTIDWLNNIYGI